MSAVKKRGGVVNQVPPPPKELDARLLGPNGPKQRVRSTQV